MSKEALTKTIECKEDQPITIETGRLAKQADGSVVVRMGNTMLLATVVSQKEAKDMPFFPLTVEYKEKFASSGKFPGGFIKREARPTEHEILTSRLVDRALRPLFPDDYFSETQVLISLISGDKNQLPDSLACLAASSAIMVSDIPFGGPVSEVRVARINGEFHVNPTLDALENADIDIMVGGTKDNVLMVEGEMKEVPETDMMAAIARAHESIKAHCEVQEELAREAGPAERRTYDHVVKDEALYDRVHEATFEKCKAVARKGIPDKKERSEALDAVRDEFIEGMSDEEKEEKEGLAKKYFESVQKEAIRTVILKEGLRPDGRSATDIRQIWSEVDYLPGTHGSSIFTRGETQSLTTLTVGTRLDEQTIDGAILSGSESFLLHYNFPPFCTGEAKPLRGTSRREVGHGNLAQRALRPVLPPMDTTPYTIRLVSDILESNGSSSMATVCAGSLALMDAGVQVNKPVSGIAMGLISDGTDSVVLSDILGDEDHLGDMDFKVTGTKDGITACQMDIKMEGLSNELMEKALHQAREGRLHILSEMAHTISEPRPDFKEHAPRIISLEVPSDSIGEIIGPGGKVIQELQAQTSTTITVDESNGVGKVEVSSDDKNSIDEAIKKIKEIAFPPTVEEGEEYEGKVKSIMPYGAFVELIPNTDGLLHISEIDWERIDKVEDVLQEGDNVKVKVKGKDPKTGKISLSRKVLLPKPENKQD